MGNIGNVIAAVGLVLDQVLIEVGRQVSVLRIDQRSRTGDFHRLRVRANRHLQVGDRRLANVDRCRSLGLAEARSRHRDGVGTRTQQ